MKRKRHRVADPCADARRKIETNPTGGDVLSQLRRKTLGAVLSLLFVSIAMPGCLSLVLGRELMEGARGEPEVRDTTLAYDISHTFLTDATTPDQVHETKTEKIPIDHTVQLIIINFQVSMHYDDIDDIVPDFVPSNFLDQMDQRYVEVSLRPCDSNGANCGAAVYYERTNKSFAQNRTVLNADEMPFIDGMWRLDAEGQGVGIETGTPLDFQDSWTLRVTVIRPCLAFPENPEVCTPSVEFE
jgi:hypothetical protein